MPRFNEILNSFTNGEVSPRIYGRTDSEIYKRSLRELKNMNVLPQGGVARRVGSETITDVVPDFTELYLLDEGSKCVPFVISEDEAYVIIFNKFQDSTFGINYVHVYDVKTEEYYAIQFLNVPISASGPVSARAPDTTSTAQKSDLLQDSDVLSELYYTQVGGVMIFTHPQLPPFVIMKGSAGNIEMGSYMKQFTGPANDIGPIPFMDLNFSAVTIAASATTGTITLTASADLFQDGHIGSYFAFQSSGTVGMVVIVAVASATSATAVVVRTLPGTSATTNWYEAAWSNLRGWPRTVAYWNGSLYFGGSRTFPDRVWKSTTFNIFQMTNVASLDPGATVTADDPFYGDIGANHGQSTINYIMAGSRDLLVGTRGREYSISAFNFEEISVRPQTSFGSEYVLPTMVDDSPVYVQRGYKKLREVLFEERNQGYVSPEVTFLCEHMTYLSEDNPLNPPAKIKEIHYQALDNSILYFLDTNGALYSLTKSRENGVQGASRVEIAGDAKVISLAVAPNKEGTSDSVYMLVNRDGAISFEKIGDDFRSPDLYDEDRGKRGQPVFLDEASIFKRYQPTFFAPLKIDDDAVVGAGTLTGATTGTVTYTLDRAKLATDAYVTYSATDQADSLQVGTIRFWSNMHKSGRTFFSISQSDASANNLIRLRSASGVVRLTINDSTGTAIINDVVVSDNISFSSGPLLFELCYDLTAGATRLFINGVQHVATITSTGTRSGAVALLQLGANYDAGDKTDPGYIWDFQVYDSVLFTANHEIIEFQPLDNTLYGLTRFEGEEVSVVANGNYVGDFTVTGGSITISGHNDDDIIIVGRKYGHYLETQPLEAGAGIGSAQGAIKRIDRAVVRLNQTAAAKVGPPEGPFEDIVFRTGDEPAGAPITLYTGDKIVEFSGTYDRLARLVIKGDAPLPCNVTCVILRGVTGDA